MRSNDGAKPVESIRTETAVWRYAFSFVLAAGLACEPRVEIGGSERPVVDLSYCASSQGSPLLARADSLVSRLVQAINDSDTAAVAGLASAPGEQLDTLAAAGALAGYRHHFEEQHIAECELVEEFPGPDTHFVYRLKSVAGSTKDVGVYHDQRHDHLRAYDEFLRYFGRAQRHSAAIVAAIRSKDPRELARLLSIDDLDYPVWLAEQAVENYRRQFDLPEIQLHYEGLERTPRMGDLNADLNRWFIYRITGTKGGRAVEHGVVISHGDGLLGWRDPLVPPYHGE
jgi:hypothetical protein